MANRYWIGGSGGWDDTAHWSTTDGGGGGSAKPGTTDDVYITASSGLTGGQITLHTSNNALCQKFTSTAGYAYTIDNAVGEGQNMQVHGDAVFESTMTINVQISMEKSGAQSLTTGGASFNSGILIYTGPVTLLDNIVWVSSLIVYKGTFDANDFNIKAGSVTFGGYGQTVAVSMGDGTWTIDPNPAVNVDYSATGNVTGVTWAVNSATVTVTAEGSTIILDNSRGPWGVGGSGTTLCFGNTSASYNTAGQTFNNIQLTGTSECDFRIGCTNTFTDFTIDADAPFTVYFQAGLTQTMSSFSLSGTSSDDVTLNYWIPVFVQSTDNAVINGDVYSNAGINYVIVDAATWNWSQNFLTNVFWARAAVDADPQFVLSQASGTNQCLYLDISNSNATGGATWYAVSSNDTVNNDGWTFRTPYTADPYNLDGSVTYGGIYTLGRYSKNYPMVLDVTYPISAGVFTGVEIGSIMVVGNDFYVSWKTYDGGAEYFGIDKIDYTAKYTAAQLETRLLTGNRGVFATFKDFILSYAELPAGTSYTLKYSKDYGTTWTEITLTDDTMRKILSGDEMVEATTLQLQLTANVSTNDAPSLEKGVVNIE